MSIKDCFVSRFKGGYIIEADFSQLEVIGAAILSGDENMRKDILDGVDSHSQSASWLNDHTYEEILAGYRAGDPYFEKMRKKAKAPRFELQFGAGAASIAENNGIKKKAAQGFIDRYYERYSQLKQWQNDNLETVRNSRTVSDLRTDLGFPAGTGELRSVTGRRFVFREYDSPEFMKEKGRHTSFSPTQIKNWPIQSFSTGDIVPEVLGKLWKELYNGGMYKECLPINTIHDSIIFDCKQEAVDDACRMIKKTMENAPQWMYERFGIHIDLPLAVDVKIGKTWGNVTNWKGA